MVAGIAENGVRFAGERADDSEVGGVSAAENEGSFRSLPAARARSSARSGGK